MSIQLKSIYDAPSADDGHRVLATQYWPRGVRKGAVDDYIRVLAPSRELLRAFKDDAIGWDEFSRRYRAEIADRAEAPSEIERLRGIGERETVTLMCTCRDSEHCHRTLLKALIKG
ncbi:MAG: hypothetical protein JW395_0789 [Nitrospira sp.]|nr:hypothetical protein [Nitrospira sp.]